MYVNQSTTPSSRLYKSVFSQCNVATCCRCGWIFNDIVIANLLLNIRLHFLKGRCIDKSLRVCFFDSHKTNFLFYVYNIIFDVSVNRFNSILKQKSHEHISTGYGMVLAPKKVTLCQVTMKTHRALKIVKYGKLSVTSRVALPSIPRSVQQKAT